LTVEQRVALAGALIRAMAIIHGKGFAHRDLKPENVIVTSDRGLFLVDFGFSKSVTDQQASSVTTAKGTPAYMAPELWSKGSNVDLMRADIYAVGKILVQILSATPYTSITESLLKDDPSLRPPSGIDLLLLWENGGTAVHAAADWKRMVGDLTAETLSHDLLNAAKKLLYAHRNDEAYWLLVESLEENGDNREAIELMGSFQNRSRKRAGIYHYLFFALVLVVGVLLAFMAGTKSSSRIVSTNDALKKERTSLLSSPNDGSAIAGDLTLREDTVHTDKLSGRLVVRNVPEDAQLYIDAKIADSDSAGEPGYFLHWGEHVVFLNDTTGRMLSRCIVKLLPFQTKAIDLSVQIAETEREY
jgi:serine/threonine protein kinase